MTRREENAAATRAALVEAARELFTEHGYAQVSTAQVVAAARVTRGALYHHFEDKRDLMRAVFAQVDHELVGRVTAAVADVEDPWERLVAGLDAFLAATEDEQIRRIVFLEAPAALGWADWRRLDAGESLKLVVGQIRGAVAAGQLRAADPVSLAHLLLGALNEGGMFIATSRSPKRARTAVAADMHALLGGLRTA